MLRLRMVCYSMRNEHLQKHLNYPHCPIKILHFPQWRMGYGVSDEIIEIQKCAKEGVSYEKINMLCSVNLINP